MAKVVLIRPRSYLDSIAKLPRLPLALLYIGSVLKQNGHEVEIIDTNVERNYSASILTACKEASVVGISALTSEVKGGLAISRMIKENTDVPLVWGGIHPSLFPEMTCEDDLVDFVICGEGEHTMVELVEALEHNRTLNGIDGLVYHDGRKVVKNQPRPYIRLDDMPTIDYSLVDMNKYIKDDTWRRAIDVQTSRGCPFKCRYCVNYALGTHKMRFMSADRVVSECERLVKEYGVNYITFIDDNFFIDKKRAVDICEGIIKRNLKIEWFAEVRADFFKPGFLDRDFLRLAEASGLRNLTIGAESGVPWLLEAMGKGITVEDILNSATMLTGTGISAAYSFIIGLPDETAKDIIETLSFVERLRKIYPRAVFNICVLRAYPKTEFTEHFIQQGWITSPKTLREFAMDKHNKVYTSARLKPVWHSNPDFAYAVASYSPLAYGSFNRDSVRRHLTYASILLLPELVLQKLALWRLRHRFFWFRLDIYISRVLRYMYLAKWARNIVRWKIDAK